MSGPRNFAGGAHPNAVIARRELERQERSRLRRLSEARKTPSNTSAYSGGTRPSSSARERPCSAGRYSRSSSRPTSGQLSGHRQGEEFESLKSRVDQFSSPGSSPSRVAFKGGRRSSSETSSARLRTSFMLSPQRRLEDAANQFHVSTMEQAQALQEELQSWYFSSGVNFNIEVDTGSSGDGQSIGSPNGGVWVDISPRSNSQRPGVDILEEAAAAVKAKVAATGAFGPPPPMPGSSRGGTNTAERPQSVPGRGVSGGCRGVAAATANRQRLPAGIST